MFRIVPAPNGFLCPDDPGEPGRDKPRWSVNAVEARIVSELCRGLRVLEIGTGLGVATREIARRARMVYTVDVDPWVQKTVAPTLPPNVIFFDDIQKVEVGDLDAAFIDGLHTLEQCSQDIRDARGIVKEDGLFIFHDANMKSVFTAVHESNLESVYIKTSAGMALAWNGG